MKMNHYHEISLKNHVIESRTKMKEFDDQRRMNLEELETKYIRIGQPPKHKKTPNRGSSL
jgi:hypothetical protein